MSYRRLMLAPFAATTTALAFLIAGQPLIAAILFALGALLSMTALIRYQKEERG